jgi:LysR family transcriptional regulator, salicylic acid-responsive activator of bsdBCD
MDIKQLKYFEAIAEEGHITKAAKRLFMTQPSLSQQLKILENELGVTLVERSSRGIRLTDAGHLLQERAGQILALLRTTTVEIRELHAGSKGTLTIGTIASSGGALLPGFIRTFQQNYPCVKFQFWEGDTYRILDLLNNGVIEVGIARPVFKLEDYNWLDLPAEPMMAAMAKESSAACIPPMIPIEKLEGKPLLLHRSNVAMVTDCCRRSGFEPDVLCIGDDVRSLLALADEGVGVALVAQSALTLVPKHHLQYSALAGSPLVIKKSVVWLRQRNLSALAKHFISVMFPDG